MELITESQYNEALAIVKAYKKQPCEHWKAIVDCWFVFYEKRKDYKPSFEPIDSNNLKKIIIKLKSKSAEKGYTDWSEAYCLKVLNHFLTLAYSNSWLSENFLLSNLNSKFDTIITTNGKATTSKSKPTISTQSAYEQFNAMFGK